LVVSALDLLDREGEAGDAARGRVVGPEPVVGHAGAARETSVPAAARLVVINARISRSPSQTSTGD
jgi:hypothetical protein